jgi:hypothetical protein
MRIGDFAVEVVARGKGIGVREVSSGHVLARPGQVYALRLRNFGPLRCVADITIDGRSVSAGGLVIEPWCTEEFERPISPDEDGRFTVVAEGDERVFGPDGGRDNPKLGLIEVRFRRELPGTRERPRPLPPTIYEDLDRVSAPQAPQPGRIRPEVSPIWNVLSRSETTGHGRIERIPGSVSSTRLNRARVVEEEATLDDVEQAAGTGLTGHSSQRFVPTQLGPLESEATVIQLRLVIASVEVIAEASALTSEPAVPSRPAARP